MTEAATKTPFAALRKFARRQPKSERCELCGLSIEPEHQHVLELNSRRIVCACDGCAILFSSQQGARYRRVPRRVENLIDLNITDEQWDNLHLPINLAFFYVNSTAKRVVAMFPSPAGATESLLTLAAWEDLAKENPVLRELEPDVEALLVNRTGPNPHYCRAPIDECYKLVGLIRMHWRGLSGGTEVWKEITRFFSELEGKSVSREGSHG